ncbi:hypothetical protein [Prosthecobacter sp.]|uniref:hypothetical protein n=1 Tax=Prosthecobacter sp. TaxID=1965333 RepID=UPI0037837616
MNEIFDRPEYSDLLPKPGTYLRRCLDSIRNPRRHRWNSYLRACKKIPLSSPVHGSTHFDLINQRRVAMITAAGRTQTWDTLDADPEFIALQNAASEWNCGQLIAGNFLNGRLLRRLEKLHPSARAA